jgi:hypothetical protein
MRGVRDHPELTTALQLIGGHCVTDATGAGVVDETCLPDRLDDVAQRVVYHPVTERGGADPARFTLVEGKVAIWTGPVCLGRQFILQLGQFPLQKELERGHVRAVALTFAISPERFSNSWMRGYSCLYVFTDST